MTRCRHDVIPKPCRVKAAPLSALVLLMLLPMRSRAPQEARPLGTQARKCEGRFTFSGLPFVPHRRRTHEQRAAIGAAFSSKDIAMIIGRFTYDAFHDTYRGAILSLGLRTRLRLTPNAEPCRDLPFDYWVEAITPLGDFTCGRGTRCRAPSGAAYIRVALHDPALRQSIIGHLWRDATGHATLSSVQHRRCLLAFLRSLFS